MIVALAPIVFATGSDSVEVEEVYCPEVGLVSFVKEHHWWETWGSISGPGFSDSGVCLDRWRLSSYSLYGP